MRANPLRRVIGLALALWLVLPMIPLALWSFAYGYRFPSLFPNDWTLAAWTYALSPSAGVLGSAGTTLFIAGATTSLALLLGVPAGRALGLHAFRGRSAVLLLLLAPAVLPGIALAPGLHALFLQLGLTGTVTGVVLAHLVPVLPYVTLVMASVFAGLDTRAEDQASSLGASPARVLWHVTLPAIRPGLVVAALFAALVSWSQYLLTLSIGGGRVQTLPLVLFTFATSGRNDVTGAVAILYMLPGVLAVAFSARFLTGQSLAFKPRVAR
jgi:putative spermidine/putrescine transport system permease protein